MATEYIAPVEEFVFLLDEVIGPELEQADSDLSGDDVRQILDEAARFFQEVWAPLDTVGDEQGCVFRDGAVTTPAGFRQAYAAFLDAGWNSVAAPAEFGGAGLSELIGQAVREFASSSCNSLGLYSGLTNGAHATIRRNGAPWMLEHVVPFMVAGKWTGTMCLTEPHCGTDLRLMTTRARPEEDGTYRLTGTKIFISGGDHDLADNIIHLVLAKLPDENGAYSNDLSSVSLFLVPKFKVDPISGALGAANGVQVGGVEHKMGLKGNATCTLNFEGSIGYRLGRSDTGTCTSSSGMRGMFEMMNSARLGTGLQALASAQRAYTHAANYARERLAGRAGNPADRSGAPADPIIVHPDVRRLLIKQASFIEAGRALGLLVRGWLDEAGSGERARRGAVGRFLTPVIKAFFSDRAFESSNDAMQLMGGHGYIRENGVEQLVRDGRIFQLYEGANGVQALDLVLRKLGADNGVAFFSFLSMVREAGQNIGPDSSLLPHADALMAALQILEECGRWFLDDSRDAYDAGASSYDFLTMIGIFSCGYMWLLMALRAEARLRSSPQDAFSQRKLHLAQYWFDRELPMIASLKVRVQTGHACLMGLPAELF
ncbi:acyl-CoA dehydrogenase [Advenella mimigardefordensis]|uniref:Putative acyl-CoA dehydrogenase n=1 Tax=Advenella mimigardefordensis (strain DSM 17166 / LMG 22922 / DPN7) TaxID=1247726 RepID=W0PHZ5_ADVMD|nr:acyl-CoA dehydrogenase [Advenella mimigardefordensis]AHG64563.1 putative acyl-CoA dehydrogenase [Advenella mimigardefordensis DPN7]